MQINLEMSGDNEETQTTVETPVEDKVGVSYFRIAALTEVIAPLTLL